MAMNFEDTINTKIDFHRPLLDAAEERLAREMHAGGETDLRVDSLNGSLLGRVLNYFSAKR
jgi:hypothetical protein